MSGLLENLIGFSRVLRHAGIRVQPARVPELVTALGLVDLGSREDVYYACRTLLLRRHDEIPLFDRAFEVFWSRRRARAAPVDQDGFDRLSGRSAEAQDLVASDMLLPEDAPEGADDDRGQTEDPARGLKTWSRQAGLASRDLAALTADEWAQARDLLARLPWDPGERRTRRWVAGNGPRIDLKRAIARSVPTGGDIVSLPRRTKRMKPVRLVLLCDVSGSMERYVRALLHFAYALSRRHTVETFLFSTTVTRITRELGTARPDEVMSAVVRTVHDWSGGTRIGSSMREFHQRWGRRVLYGAPMVLIVSDGWDCGDPAELAAEIARLQRSARRLIWLNPLIGTTGYEPLTRGLQAALPFVDDFMPVRTLNNLTDLAVHLSAVRS